MRLYQAHLTKPFVYHGVLWQHFLFCPPHVAEQQQHPYLLLLCTSQKKAGSGGDARTRRILRHSTNCFCSRLSCCSTRGTRQERYPQVKRGRKRAPPAPAAAGRFLDLKHLKQQVLQHPVLLPASRQTERLCGNS